MPERRFVYTPAMVGLTALVLLVPLAGLALLLQRPRLDVHGSPAGWSKARRAGCYADRRG